MYKGVTEKIWLLDHYLTNEGNLKTQRFDSDEAKKQKQKSN